MLRAVEQDSKQVASNNTFEIAHERAITINNQVDVVRIKAQSVWDGVFKQSCSILLGMSSTALSYGIFLAGERLDNDTTGVNWVGCATGKFVKFILITGILSYTAFRPLAFLIRGLLESYYFFLLASKLLLFALKFFFSYYKKISVASRK